MSLSEVETHKVKQGTYNVHIVSFGYIFFTGLVSCLLVTIVSVLVS